MAAAFDGVFLLGDVPGAVAAAITGASARPARMLSARAVPLDDRGRAPVPAIIRAARQADPGSRRLLVVSAADLAIPEMESLFGFADRRRGVAVVSTARLGDADPATTAARVLNAIAHEAGHLDGLGHCATSECLMRRVTTPAQIDARSGHACGRCPRPGGLWRHVAAAAALLAIVATLVLALDVTGTAVFGRGPSLEFTCRAMDSSHAVASGTGAADHAMFHFQGRPLFAIYDKDGHANILDRSRPMMHRLNELWQSDEPVVISVHEAGGAIDVVIDVGGGSDANGVHFASVLRGDARSRPAGEVAGEWVSQIAALFREHGKDVSIR